MEDEISWPPILAQLEVEEIICHARRLLYFAWRWYELMTYLRLLMIRWLTTTLSRDWLLGTNGTWISHVRLGTRIRDRGIY